MIFVHSLEIARTNRVLGAEDVVMLGRFWGGKPVSAFLEETANEEPHGGGSVTTMLLLDSAGALRGTDASGDVTSLGSGGMLGLWRWLKVGAR